MRKNSAFFGLIFIVVGLIWTGANLGLLSEDLWKYWPLILVVVGVWKIGTDLATRNDK